MFLLIILLLEPLRSGMPNKPRPGKFLKCKGCDKKCYMPLNRLETFKYCSRECKNKFGCTDKIRTICAVCNKEFEHISCRANKAKYCSRICFHRSQIGRGHREFKCQYCGQIFNDSPSVKRKFCSKSCVGKAHKTVFKPIYST